VKGSGRVFVVQLGAHLEFKLSLKILNKSSISGKSRAFRGILEFTVKFIDSYAYL
jgi:hypothetical protein